MIRRALALCAVLSLCSCAATQRWTASRYDYRLYREARLAESNQDRLEKSWRYLRELPSGRFRAEVEGWFRSAEPRFYAAARDRPSLLRAYLRAMPDGPHARAARDRVEELELLREYRVRAEQRERARLERIEADLARARNERRAFVIEVTELTRALAAVRSFGAPSSALAPELRARLGPLQASCDGKRCSNRFVQSYSIPENRELVSRHVELELAVDVRRGHVTRASLSAPLLFNRLAEALDVTAISPTDLRGRVEAIARSAQALSNIVEPQLPAAECTAEAIAARVVVRQCRGVRFELRAGIAAGDADYIEVSAPGPGRR